MSKEAKKLNPLTMTDQELIEHCNKQVQALRMALDMIECEKHDRRHVRWAIVDALKEWQPAQQEPLEYWNAVEGWVKVDEVREHFDSVGCGTIYKTPGDGRVPLTTAQRTWVGLTDEEMQALWNRYAHMEMMRAIEAKLKEKNT